MGFYKSSIIFLIVPMLSMHLLSCTDQSASKNMAAISLTTPSPVITRQKNTGIEAISVSSLNIYPTNFSITRLDETVQLKLNALLNNGEIFADTGAVQWSSSDESVILVDESGLLTAQGIGSATITGELAGFSQSIKVSVDESGRVINGLVRYEDREYDRNGLIIFPQTPNYKAVRYATIDLLDRYDRIIRTIETSNAGRFNFGNIMLDDYRIRVLSQVENEIAQDFVVKDMRENIYTATIDADSSTTTHDMQITEESGIAGAFNILDVMTAAADFSRQMLATSVQGLNVFWAEGNDFGTYYCADFDIISCRNGEGIYVLSQHRLSFGVSEADYDEYDDDVLMHEYGHYLVENFAQDDSPGGCHNLTDNNLDLRLAWSEGLGTFFPIAVKDWLRKTNPLLMSMSSTEPVTLYVDTVRTRANPSEAFINFDVANFEDADPNVSPDTAEVYFYASSEIAILKILWRLSEEFGMDRIWDVVSNYFKQAAYPTNLATFWDGFTSRYEYDANELESLQSIFNERRVYYQDDSYEIDDLANPTLIDLTADAQADHYLYRSLAGLDTDIYAFDGIIGSSYHIQTQELHNGIDTVIRVLDEQGDLVKINAQAQENDDANPNTYLRYDPSCFGGSDRIFVDKNSLASSLVFKPAYAGRYFVEVAHHIKFADPDNFTGHYGSYQLSIVEQ